MPYKDPEKTREANRRSYEKNKHQRGANVSEEAHQAKLEYMANWRESNREVHRRGSREWYAANKDRILERQREHRAANPEVYIARAAAAYERDKEKILERNKLYREQNKEKIAEAARKKYLEGKLSKADSFIALKLRDRFKKALKRCYKGGSAIADLGCSIPEFKAHIEKQFTEGMSWDNHGEWHLDHIKSLASFDLSNADEAKAACHYTNYQPLWALDNQRKGRGF